MYHPAAARESSERSASEAAAARAHADALEAELTALRTSSKVMSLFTLPSKEDVLTGETGWAAISTCLCMKYECICSSVLSMGSGRAMHMLLLCCRRGLATDACKRACTATT